MGKIKTTYTDLNNRLRGMIQPIKNDRSIQFTVADRAALGIKIETRRTRIPRPVQAPIMEVYKTEIGKVAFIGTNTIDGIRTNTEKHPTDVDRIGIATATAFTTFNASLPRAH